MSIFVIDALTLLQSCEADIEAACTPSLNVSNDHCNILTNKFVDDYNQCDTDFDGQPQQKCNCITDLTADYEVVKSCKGQSVSTFQASNKERNACNKVFPACKSMIPVVLEAVIECKSTFSRSSECGCAQNSDLIDRINYDILDFDVSTVSPGKKVKIVQIY